MCAVYLQMWKHCTTYNLTQNESAAVQISQAVGAMCTKPTQCTCKQTPPSVHENKTHPVYMQTKLTQCTYKQNPPSVCTNPTQCMYKKIHKKHTHPDALLSNWHNFSGFHNSVSNIFSSLAGRHLRSHSWS